jgi:D-3-phosphoglycerate dehydrogenase
MDHSLPGTSTGPAFGGRHRVLVTATALAPAALRRLADAECDVHLLRGDGGPPALADELLRTLSEFPFDAVISRTLPLTAQAIEACRTLRVICKHGVGVNNIDVGAAGARGIPVYITPGANAQSVAELAVGLMIAAARRLSWLDTEVRQGRWSRFQGGIQLSGRTLGIVGFGNIGQRVARAALGLGMRVVAFDPVAAGEQLVVGVELVDSLDKLLTLADAVTLHVPLTPETGGLIGARELALLRPGAILINTARSPIVDEDALIAALGAGHLRAAGLDLTNDGPLPPGHPLVSLHNVVLTPHVGGSTDDALAAVALHAADNVLAVLSGELPDRALCVNPEVLAG